MSMHPPCAPPPAEPCPQVCPKPPATPCLGKPTMRGLHWTQTRRVIASSLALSCFGGFMVFMFIGRPRKAAYHAYHKNDFDAWEEEMARKGLFQAVPKDSLID